MDAAVVSRLFPYLYLHINRYNMEFGISLHSVIPVRLKPLHTAELVTQILFGELYRVVARENNWLRIQLLYDNYEGWIHPLQHQFIAEEEFLRLAGSETLVTRNLIQFLTLESKGTMIPVLLGSSLPGYKGGRFSIGQDKFHMDGSELDQSTCDQFAADQSTCDQLPSDQSLDERVQGREERSKTIRPLVDNAMLYLHAPYLWGGRTPFGIDCSGFVQMVFKLNNIKLLRDATQQASQGEVISLLGEAEPGDLAFFDDEEGKITHVGLLLDRARIIHCSGKVRIDTLDHQGIYNEEVQKYTHKLRLIKRIA